jgi:hypothetical protein
MPEKGKSAGTGVGAEAASGAGLIAEGFWAKTTVGKTAGTASNSDAESEIQMDFMTTPVGELRIAIFWL